MKVSVICPTYNRQDRLANLYAAFAHQNYADRELLIADDSEEKSPFFSNLKDPRVKYTHLDFRTSVGFKRNLLSEMASGEVIAHFDDDDYYAPSYLTEMVRALGSADFIKLSKWLAWREWDGTLWECDTRNITEPPLVVKNTGEVTRYNKIIGKSAEWMKNFNFNNMWGYGFSYAYRKSVWKECSFEDVNYGEDFEFICGLIKLRKKVTHTPELFKLALHIMHANNLSIVFPQKQLDSKLATSLIGPECTPWLVLNTRE